MPQGTDPGHELTPEDIRMEFSALSSYFNTVITFRFTNLGFYLAAVGFIVAGEATRAKGLLLLRISIALWLVELRNRSLFYNNCERAIQIERDRWGY